MLARSQSLKICGAMNFLGVGGTTWSAEGTSLGGGVVRCSPRISLKIGALSLNLGIFLIQILKYHIQGFIAEFPEKYLQWRPPPSSRVRKCTADRGSSKLVLEWSRYSIHFRYVEAVLCDRHFVGCLTLRDQIEHESLPTLSFAWKQAHKQTSYLKVAANMRVF